MFEMIFNGIFALLLIAFAVMGARFPDGTNKNDIVGAKGFPVGFAVIALILLAWEIIAQIKKKKSGEAEDSVKSFDKTQYPKFFIVIAMTVAYIAIVKTTGFVLTTLIYTFAALNVLGSKKQLFNAIFSVLAVAALVIFFGRFFSVSLPRGVGFLKTISFYLY